MTTDDRTWRRRWPASRATAPPSLAPNVLVEVGLADRYARFDSPIGPLVVAWNGRGVSAVEAAADDATFEAAPPGPDRAPGTSRGASCPTGSPRRSRGGSSGDRRVRIDLDLRGHTDVRARRLAARRSRSRAARSGRTAGSPPRSAGRRRSGRSARRSATTRCRSSCRATASSGRDGMIGQYSLGGPANKRTILAAEGLDLPRLEGLASAGDPLHRLGHDADLLPADVPRTPGGSPTATARVPLDGARAGRGLPGLPRLPARRRRGRRLRPPTRRAGRAGGLRRSATGRRNPRMPILRLPWTIRLCQLPSRHPRRAGRSDLVGMLVLYLVWGSTYLGIAVAVETIPPFLMAAARFLLAGLILLTWSSPAKAGRSSSRPGASGATARSSARCCSAAGWAWSPSASRPSRRASRRC